MPVPVLGILPYTPQYSNVEFPSVFATKVDRSYFVMYVPSALCNV